MGRFCNGLLATFRIIQYLFSIIALGCGAYITYELYTISDSAHLLEQSIVALQNGTSNDVSLDKQMEDGLQNLADLMVNVMQFLEGTPVRAIVVSAVGLWSIIIITYLFFAHRIKNHPAANKRSIRVPLELITILAWLAAIICSVLLALEYGILAVTCGAEAKTAIKLCMSALQEVLQQTDSGKNVSAALDIVSDVITMGWLSITSVVASGFCCMVSFISLVVACCMSGKGKGSDAERGGLTTSMVADPSMIGYVGKPVDYLAETNSSTSLPTIVATRY